MMMMHDHYRGLVSLVVNTMMRLVLVVTPENTEGWPKPLICCFKKKKKKTAYWCFKQLTDVTQLWSPIHIKNT